MEFFFLQFNHCTRMAKLLNQLSQEMGPRGFPAVGIVFDPPDAPESHGQLVAPAVNYFKWTYPVGYSSKLDVDSYLNGRPREVLNIPQMVVIDRRGMIRAMSGAAGGDARLEDESSLRSLTEGLLKEGVASETGEDRATGFSHIATSRFVKLRKDQARCGRPRRLSDHSRIPMITTGREFSMHPFIERIQEAGRCPPQAGARSGAVFFFDA